MMDKFQYIYWDTLKYNGITKLLKFFQQSLGSIGDKIDKRVGVLSRLETNMISASVLCDKFYINKIVFSFVCVEWQSYKIWEELLNYSYFTFKVIDQTVIEKVMSNHIFEFSKPLILFPYGNFSVDLYIEKDFPCITYPFFIRCELFGERERLI